MLESLVKVPVLVTGGTGFLGSHLVRRLLGENAQVSVITKRNNPQNLKDVLDQINMVRADLADFEHLKFIVEKIRPMKIFHLAAYANPERVEQYTDLCLQYNVMGTLNLLRSLENVPYDCFINTGTCDEYGDNSVPFREDQRPNPVSPYSASKACTTVLCQMYHKAFGLPIVTLRPFLTYGPYQKTNFLVPNLILHSLMKKNFKMTRGEQTKEFNYVSDIVDGYIKASVAKNALGEIINIGNGIEVQIKEMANLICKLMHADIVLEQSLPYREGEAMHFYCDYTKARNILGWKPQCSLEEGLRRTIQWYTAEFKNGNYIQWMKNN